MRCGERRRLARRRSSHHDLDGRVGEDRRRELVQGLVADRHLRRWEMRRAVIRRRAGLRRTQANGGAGTTSCGQQLSDSAR